MSVIAAKVYEDKICIASDSILIKEELKRTNFVKLKKFGKTVCGGCGSAEELCLFFEFVKTHPIYQASVSVLVEYMHDFQNYLRDIANIEKSDNTYLIIENNKLFEVEGFFVREITDYTAIGAGEAYALTALYCGKSAEQAVKITCKLCSTVCEPVTSFVYMKE